MNSDADPSQQSVDSQNPVGPRLIPVVDRGYQIQVVLNLFLFLVIVVFTSVLPYLVCQNLNSALGFHADPTTLFLPS